MHRRQPGSEFPNDNHALHGGAVWVCHEPTDAPSAIGVDIEPDGDEWFGAFAHEDATHAYDLPPVSGVLPAMPLFPAPPGPTLRNDFVVFYPPPPDLWKRETDEVSRSTARVAEAVVPPVPGANEDLGLAARFDFKGDAIPLSLVERAEWEEGALSVSVAEPAIFGFLEEIDALRDAVRLAQGEIEATPTTLGSLDAVLDEAFAEPAERRPSFSPVVSLGPLAELVSARVHDKVTVAQSWLPPAPRSEIRALAPKPSQVVEAVLAPRDVLQLDLTPAPSDVVLGSAPSPETPIDVVEPGPRATRPDSDRPEVSDGFAQLSHALSVVAMSRGATKAAASVPRLLAGERLTESDLPERAVEALERAGFALHRAPFVVPTESFVNTAGAWRQLLRGELHDFSACGEDTLDGWASRLLAALLATEPGAVRKDLRKAGVAAFGMKRAA